MTSEFRSKLASLMRDCAWESELSALKTAEEIARLEGDDVVPQLLAEVKRLDDVDLSDDAGDVSDELWRLTQAFAAALGKRRPPPTQPLLELLRDDDHPLAQRCAIQALGLTEDPDAVEPLMALAPSHRSAIISLGHLKDARALPVLFSLLDTPRDQQNAGWTRRVAASALGEIDDARAIPLLAARLHPDNPWFERLGAAEGLARMSSPDARKALEPARSDENENVRRAARGG